MNPEIRSVKQVKMFTHEQREKYYPSMTDGDNRLRNICEASLQNKYRQPVIKDAYERLNYELGLIEKSGQSFIFLHILEVMKRHELNSCDIICTGSIGNSIVAYLTGLTVIDPIEYRLDAALFYGINGNKRLDFALRMPAHKKKCVLSDYSGYEGIEVGVRAGCLFEEGDGRFSRHVHPGAIFVLPKGASIVEEIPLGISATGEICTFFDYHDYTDSFVRVDYLEDNAASLLYELSKSTGIKPNDDAVVSASVTNMLKEESVDYLCDQLKEIPIFNQEYAIELIRRIKPQNFGDVVTVALLSLENENGVDLGIRDITTTRELGENISAKDDLLRVLSEHDIDKNVSLKITEAVGIGKVMRGTCDNWSKWKKLLHSHGVRDEIVELCENTDYLYPKAHGIAFTNMSLKLLWYKQNFPDVYDGLYKKVFMNQP